MGSWPSSGVRVSELTARSLCFLLSAPEGEGVEELAVGTSEGGVREAVHHRVQHALQVGEAAGHVSSVDHGAQDPAAERPSEDGQ